MNDEDEGQSRRWYPCLFFALLIIGTPVCGLLVGLLLVNT